MREIKFKVFFKNTNEMTPPFIGDIDFDGCWYKLRDFFNKELYTEDDVDVMQFTGLLDKKGKEIFEGDIIRRLDGRTDVVVFDQGMFTTKENDWDLRWLVNHRILELDEDIEIIGNIHENPELLKGESE